MPNWLVILLIIIGSLIILGIAINLFKFFFGILMSVIGAAVFICDKTYEIVSFPFRIVIKHIKNKRTRNSIYENEI